MSILFENYLFDDPADREANELIRSGKLENIIGKRIGDLSLIVNSDMSEKRIGFLAEKIQVEIQRKFKKYSKVTIGWSTTLLLVRDEQNYRWNVGEFVFLGKRLKSYYISNTGFYDVPPNFKRHPLVKHVDRILKKILKSKVTLKNIRELSK